MTINEIIVMVNIALNLQPIENCEAGDPDHKGSITVADIIKAVNNALLGCGHTGID